MESDGDQEKFFNRAGQIAAEKMSQTIDAATKLAGAEKGATKPHDDSGTSGRDDSTKATKDREKEPGSSFKNNVGKDKDDKKSGFFKGKGKDKSKFSGKLNSPRNLKAAWKKGGPVGLLIVLLLLGGGGLMLGSQTAMPFAIANRLTEEFNTMGVSNNARYNTLFRYLGSKNKLSKAQIEALGRQGITVDTSGRSAVLNWEEDGPDGTKVPKSAEIKNNQQEFSKLLDENPNLKNRYQVGSQKYKGQNSGWYDNLTTKIFAGLGLKNIRSHYDDYKDTGDITQNKENLKKSIEKGRVNVADGGATNKEPKRDQDGNIEPDADGKPQHEDLPDSKAGKGASQAEVEKSFRTKALDAASSFKDVGQIACAVMQAAGAISALVSVQQTLEMMNFAGAYLESVQKVQAGEGSESPMHYFNEQLTATDKDGKSGMTSTGMASLFNNTSGNAPTDESTLGANIESLTNRVQVLGINMAFTATAFQNCSYVKAVTGGADIVMDALAIPTFGVSEGVKIFIKMVGGAAIATAISTTLNFMIPWAAGLFIRNLATDAFGETVGNTIASGATEMMSKNHQGSGGSPGTKAKVLAFKQTQQAVIAEQAEYDRATLSPFDTTSRHTFMGSIVYTLSTKMATSTGTIPNIVLQTGSILKNSLTGLLPYASAVATTDLNQYEGDCPYLNSVGGVGDAFCNPYYMTDTSTIEMDEDTLLQSIAGDLEQGSNPLNPDIKENSELAQYAEFCGNRTSLFGLADGNIASHFNNSTGVEAVDGAIGAIPIIGGANDIIEAVRETANMGWISGQNCIANDDNPFWRDHGKYYQRFMEDQRLLTNAGVIGANTEHGESHILALSDKYRTESIADQSYEGQLARLSGLTKNQVIDTLALLEEYEYIANYDPSDLGPVPAEQQFETYDFSSDSAIANINHDNPIQNSTNLAQHYVIYADLRTRTQVA